MCLSKNMCHGDTQNRYIVVQRNGNHIDDIKEDMWI